MATLEELVVKIRADMSQLDRQLNQSVAKTDAGAKKMESSFKRVDAVIGKVTAALATLALGRGLVQTITSFEKLEASLRTVTGSADKAKIAFNALQEFASKTPFQLEEMVAAFIKLRSLGLTPSEDALTSFGNTAVAMGKSLNQMIEAVADATTGEFERLKEFGIRASTEGEKVTFTFQGVSTTVGKNAKEIEAYLKSIGNVQFAGAMDEQANTLNVALSNMGDSFSKLAKAIGDAGLTAILMEIAKAVGALADAVTEFIPEFKAGFASMVLEVVKGAGQVAIALGDDADGVNALLARMDENFERIYGSGSKVKGTLDDVANGANTAAPAVAKLTKEQEALQSALDKMEKSAERNLRLVGKDGLEKASQELEDAVEDLTDKYGDLNKEQKRQVENIGNLSSMEIRLKEKIEATAKAQEEAQEAAEKFARPFVQAAENIQNALADMLVNFEFDMDSLVDIAKRAAAEMAAAMIFQPIIAPAMASAVGGMFGNQAGGAVSSGLGIGGGGIAGGLTGFNALNNFGATRAGSIFAPTGAQSLGGYLGAAGTGLAFGGLAASLTGGNSTGGAVGGALGGAVGNYFLPGIGGYLGGALGGVVGGMFGGGKPSSMFQGGGLNLGTGALSTSGLTGKKFSQQNASIRDMLLSSAANVSGLLGGGAGNVNLGYGNRNGYQLGFDGGALQSFGQDVSAFTEALFRGIADRAQDLPDNVQAALDRIDYSNLDTAIQQLNDVINFPKMISEEIQKLTDPTKYAIDQINKQFDAMAEKAKALGLDTGQVEELRRLTLEKELAGQLQETIREAERVADGFRKVVDDIDRTLLSLQTGSLSILNPMEQRQAALDALQSTARRAQLGDLSAAQQVSGLATSFLQESRDVYASSDAFKADYQLATGILSNVQGTAQRQVAAQERAIASASSGNSTASAINKLASEQAKTNAALRNIAATQAAGTYKRAV